MPKLVWQFKLYHLLYLFLLMLSALMLSALMLSAPLFAVDTDHDGLPDDWEIANGRDPLVADYAVSAAAHHACALDDFVTCSCHSFYSALKNFLALKVPSIIKKVIIEARIARADIRNLNGVFCVGLTADARR